MQHIEGHDSRLWNRPDASDIAQSGSPRGPSGALANSVVAMAHQLPCRARMVTLEGVHENTDGPLSFS
jgi:hypothetical protein